MRRREFVGRLVAVAGVAALPRVAGAQEPTPVVGFLNNRSAGQSASFIAAFSEGMRETGYLQGRNVGVEYRWSEGRHDRLAGMASDLVSGPVALIAAGGEPASSIAARGATAT